MDGRHALVVGGARGIGRAVAGDLLDRGWQVTVAGPRTRPDDLIARGARFVAMDAGRPEAADALDALPPVDALVLAAGVYRRVALADEDYVAWKAQFADNLDPVFVLGRAVLPGMAARGWGRVVTFGIANAEQLRANPFVAAHYTAKVGVLLLTRALAATAAPGVTVNCVSPGFVDSGGAPEEQLARMVKSIPAARLGTVDEAAAVVRFLLSDDAAYVSGAHIVVSGGWGI